MAKKMHTLHAVNCAPQQDEPYEVDLEEAITHVTEAIQHLSQTQNRPSIEIEICVEARSLFLAFRDFTLSHGFDESAASRVESKLKEALGTVTPETQCRRAVQEQVDVNFPQFVGRVRSTPDLANAG